MSPVPSSRINTSFQMHTSTRAAVLTQQEEEGVWGGKVVSDIHLNLLCVDSKQPQTCCLTVFCVTLVTSTVLTYFPVTLTLTVGLISMRCVSVCVFCVCLCVCRH